MKLALWEKEKKEKKRMKIETKIDVKFSLGDRMREEQVKL